MRDHVRERWLDDDALPTDGGQREIYGQPSFGRSFRDVAGRISLWSTRGAVVLRLFDSLGVEGLAVGDLLRVAGCALGAGYADWRSSSSLPIEDGYLRCLRSRRSEPRPGVELVDPVAAIEALLREEKTRFGLLVHGDIWVWSRAVHHHK